MKYRVKFEVYPIFLDPVTSREHMRQLNEILHNYQLRRFKIILSKEEFIDGVNEGLKIFVDRDPNITLDQITKVWTTILRNMGNMLVDPDDPEEVFIQDIRETKVTWDLKKREEFLNDTKGKFYLSSV